LVLLDGIKPTMCLTNTTGITKRWRYFSFIQSHEFSLVIEDFMRHHQMQVWCVHIAVCKDSRLKEVDQGSGNGCFACTAFTAED